MTSIVPIASGRLLPTAEAETVDVADLARSVRRQWRAVAVATLLGVATAGAVLLFAPRRFASAATILLRSANDPSSSILSRVGLPADIAPAALGASLKSPLETELQILVSRDVLGAVVDSLGLQARVLGRSGLPSRRLIVPATYAASFKRRTYAFDRQSGGRYRVDGPDTTLTAATGAPFQLPVIGRVTIAPTATAESFRVKFEDREDAITRVAESVNVDKKGGEVAGVGYAGPDSVTAAEVPNAIIAIYLDRRHTVDRGVNQRRYEFLRAQADSVARQLAQAEDALRRFQERSGVLDPELTGRIGAEGVRTLTEQAGAIEVERRALGQLLAQVSSGALSPRQLAAYPSFLKSDAINAILSQIAGLETERTRWLERRTERDPEVIAITTSVDNLEHQLVPLSRAYASSLDRQAEELSRQLGLVQSRLATLPGEAEASLQGQRGVRQLSTTFAALQAQIVDARLSAIGEGGQVRRIDEAEPPKKPSFPKPSTTLLAGGIGGLLLGILWALARRSLDGRVWSAQDVERATSLPAFVVRPGSPLLIGAGLRAGTVIVLRVVDTPAANARRVAQLLASEAEQRRRPVAMIDAASTDRDTVQAALAEAESAQAFVIVSGDTVSDGRTSALLESPRAVLLTANPGARRADVVEARELLARLAVACLGVAFVDGYEIPATADVSDPASTASVRRIAPTIAGGRPSRVPADGD